MECKLTYLYPDLLNLYGDRGNVAAAARTAEKMGVAFSFERVDDFDTPIDFAGSDLLLFSPGELSTFPRIIERLERDRAALEEYIESGKYILAIGGAACIFADVVNRVFRPSYQGLGLGLYDCAEREAAYGDDLIFTCSPAGTERKVAGSQIQMMDLLPKKGCEVFGHLLYGYGNNHTDGEGIRYKNLIVTNTLGPLLVKNPWVFADILRDILTKKGAEVPALPDFSLEERSLAAVEAFNLAKKSEL
ncbi:MAG: hypothetical protein ACOYKJ_01055 [Candidatus Howiella sp.]|jgi:CobQ-like glutamine amidotransferase family enzyme